MAPQRICRHAGDTMEQVQLHPTDTESRLQGRRYLCPERHICPECQHSPECHPGHEVTMLQLNVPKSSICQPDICIHILLCPALNSLHLMHMPRIASKIQILIQICWLMQEHPLVSTLSDVWYCLTSILKTRAAYSANLEVMMSIDWKKQDIGVYYYLLLADTLKFILKDIFICIIEEQWSDQGESKWKGLKGCQNYVNCRLRQIKWFNIADMPMAKWVSMERQHFRSSRTVNWKLTMSCLYIIEVLASFLSTFYSDTLPTSSWKWASTNRQQFFLLQAR